jgi:hypothetical protein
MQGDGSRPFVENHFNSPGELLGQPRGKQDYSSLFLRTMHYSLRRALSLDSGDGCTHNPKVAGSNPAPATNLINQLQTLG